MKELATVSSKELFGMRAAIEAELLRRGAIRTANAVGDRGEQLFAERFGWTLAPNSFKGYDATDETGIRYQIKSRQMRGHRPRILGHLRSFEFDVLAIVVFSPSGSVALARLIPVKVVRAEAKFIQRTNSHRLTLTDRLLRNSEVIDVTGKLACSELQMDAKA